VERIGELSEKEPEYREVLMNVLRVAFRGEAPAK
jgi:hypothetical protein